MFRKSLHFFLALLLLTASSIFAQTPDDQSPLREQEKRQQAVEMKKELERKTLALLDEIINSASTLKLPENRALVWSSAADLLWTRDEKRARALFRDALGSLRAIALRFDEKMSDEQRRNYWLFAQQRRLILQMAAHHDADLALELLRSSRPVTPKDQQKSMSRPYDDEEELEQSLAIQVADNNPQRAFQMAEDNLSRNLSVRLLDVLNHLNGKDSELAARFADDIIKRLRSENLITNPAALALAMALVQLNMIPADGPFLGLTSSHRISPPYRPSERQLRDLTDIITSPSVMNSPNTQNLLGLSPIMPELRKHFPERAQLLTSRFEEAIRDLPSEQRSYFENQGLVETSSVESLLETAAKSSGTARDMAYAQAAFKALSGGDEERARQIVGDNIKTAAVRNSLLESLDVYALWNAIMKEKLDVARLKISRLKSRDQRANALTHLALGAALKKNRKLALELLNDALPLVNFKPKNDAQLFTLLQVVRVYSLLEPARAFEMIESLVDRANELLSAASVLNGFLVPAGTFRKGELVLPPGYTNASLRFRDFGKELAALALINFDRTKAAADKLQRNEARIMARLFIAQSVLAEQLGPGIVINPMYGIE